MKTVGQNATSEYLIQSLLNYSSQLIKVTGIVANLIISFQIMTFSGCHNILTHSV